MSAKENHQRQHALHDHGGHGHGHYHNHGGHNKNNVKGSIRGIVVDKLTDLPKEFASISIIKSHVDYLINSNS